MKKFSDFNIKKSVKETLPGLKIKISGVLNRDIVVHAYQIKDSKFKDKDLCLYLQIYIDGAMRLLFTGSEILIGYIKQIPMEHFPFTTRIVEKDQGFHFS